MNKTMQIVDLQGLELIFLNLIRRGYDLVGPALRDGAIVYDQLKTTGELPAGWTDEQEGATYRLKKRGDGALFGFAVGPHSWKKYLFPPVLKLWQASREAEGFQIDPPKEATRKLAFIGVRSCELHALAIQDRIFIEGLCADPHYRQQRENLFILALNCGKAGGTCFCVSMNTGPKVQSGFDLVITEVIEGPRHYFITEAGTATGSEILREVPFEPAGDEERKAGERVIAHTAGQMGRKMETSGIKELLYQNQEHPRWDQVAARCLACGNCTMVCPTCFCSTAEEVTDLTGKRSDHLRKWDSCFTMDFSYLHGAGSVRSSVKARYRQWLTHKLASWIDQFGTSGCVGCGRCITWCPAAIDITEEVRAIREEREGKPQ